MNEMGAQMGLTGGKL